MATFIFWAIAVAAVLFLCWVSWASLQSLQQAAILRRAGSAETDGISSDETVAIHGECRVITPVSRTGFRDALWCRLKHQVRRGHGKNRRWRTVDTEEHLANFTVTFPAGTVRIEGLPTEVQATRTHTDYHDGGGLFGFIGFGPRRRTIHEWLPVPPRVTIVGRLEARGKSGVMIRDPKVGFLISPREPKAAAQIETAKGIGGFALVTAAIIGALYYYYGTQPGW